MAVVIMRHRGTPQQEDACLASIPHRIDRGSLANLGVAQHPLMQVEIVGHREDRQVTAQEIQELFLLPERQPPSDRMQAVCPYDKIECSRRSMLEFDIDS